MKNPEQLVLKYEKNKNKLKRENKFRTLSCRVRSKDFNKFKNIAKTHFNKSPYMLLKAYVYEIMESKGEQNE